MASKQTDREEAKDIIVQNGASSFVKARADWLNIDKVHLSFVQHTGLKNGCKKLAAIEAALPIYRATGKMVNNMPEDNVSGLQKLAYMVSNGSLFTRLKNSRSAALEKYRKENPNGTANGDIYCDSVFEFVGGSEAKSKNGNNIPIRYRKISIAPAAFKANRQNSNIVLEAFECDGSTTNTAGFVPQKGCPNKVQIRVGFKPAEFVVFIQAIMNVWQAELSRRAIMGEGEFYSWFAHRDGGSVAAIPQNVPTPAQIPVETAANPAPKTYRVTIIVAYDTAGALFVAATKDKFVDTLREGLRKMLNCEQAWVLPKDEADKVLAAVENDQAIPTARAHSKKSPDTYNFLNFRRCTVNAVPVSETPAQ